jgi:hypothetical protein
MESISDDIGEALIAILVGAGAKERAKAYANWQERGLPVTAKDPILQSYLDVNLVNTRLRTRVIGRSLPRGVDHPHVLQYGWVRSNSLGVSGDS